MIGGKQVLRKNFGRRGLRSSAPLGRGVSRARGRSQSSGSLTVRNAPRSASNNPRFECCSRTGVQEASWRALFGPSARHPYSGNDPLVGIVIDLREKIGVQRNDGYGSGRPIAVVSLDSDFFPDESGRVDVLTAHPYKEYFLLGRYKDYFLLGRAPAGLE